MGATLLKLPYQKESRGSDPGQEPSPGDMIPCFRCGVCCVKWQPLLSPQEIRRIAADMGLSVRAFKRRFLRRYPLRRGWYIIKADSQGPALSRSVETLKVEASPKGCLFLGFDGPLATCAIYDFRPEVCRSWEASLARSECQEGLPKMAISFHIEPEKKETAFGRDELPA